MPTHAPDPHAQLPEPNSWGNAPRRCERRESARLFRAVAVGAVALLIAAASADEAAIRADLKAFFETQDPASRQRYAERIAADPAYDPQQLGKWLHEAGLFAPLAPGRQNVSVRVPPAGSEQERSPLGRPQTWDPRARDRAAGDRSNDGGEAPAAGTPSTLSLRLRIPPGYDEKKPWSVIYCLHGTGGSADSILDYVEKMLGEAGDLFILAAPEGYREVGIHQEWPPRGEHAAALRHLRRVVNVDSDRVFVTGYSRGGHTAWTLAVLMADEFAGALPLAGTLLLPEVEALWTDFLPNARSLPVLCVWGEFDTDADGGESSPQGGIARLNRELVKKAKELSLPVTGIELRETGHGEVLPPLESLARLLAARRQPWPKEAQSRFRHISQARCYWVEGHTWTGPKWDDKPLRAELREGESVFDDTAKRAALQRAYRQRLGSLSAEVRGNEIRIGRKQVSELTVWIGLDMVDWSQPISLFVSGREVHRGTLEPDLLLCLNRASETWDFERLAWGGVYFTSGRKAVVLRGTMEP